jgi:hypothetical protein
MAGRLVQIRAPLHGGFTTGTEGDTLTAVTTHFKMGDIKRHRAFSSDRATLTYRSTGTATS